MSAAAAELPADRVDWDAFLADLDALGRAIRADLSDADLRHFRRIARIGRAATAAGWATSWLGPNLVSAALLAQGRTTRWTTVAHHVSHGGYARLPGAAPAPRTFARGWRRLVDWLDVIDPDAWHHEHDVLHHTRLGETADPDLVEANLGWLRDAELPLPAKYAIVAALAAGWKWIYYAPNTLQELRAHETGQPRRSLRDPGTWDPRTEDGRHLWRRCLLPYAIVNFGLVPALFLPLGPLAVASSVSNSVLAEILTNLHTFAIITTNHAGDDLYAFEGPPSDRRAFLVRQILGSTNYACGDDLTDLLHGWLNYQIEHHVWPDLTLLQYRKVQPRLEALCARHGVPYVRESVWRRVRQTVDVMVGARAMRRDAPV